MLVAEAETVRFHAHVGLHHGRAGNVGGHAVLEHVAHAAERAAVLRLENFTDRYRANVFTHFGFLFS